MHMLKRILLTLIPLTAAADYSLARECDGIRINQRSKPAVLSGPEQSFKFIIENIGKCTLAGATITDYLPVETRLRSAEPHPFSRHAADAILEHPEPQPVEKVRWKDVDLGSGSSTVEYTVTVEIYPVPGLVYTNTVCFEHPKTGRICDDLDIEAP